jgi:UDP-N-acetylmuramoyl-L-alanyl-D-glutamate--2,6-diaminopimelate ligase
MAWWQAVEQATTLGDLPDVDDITHDSRRARPGVAFAALPGRRLDGHDFLESALAAGAPAAVVQADHQSKWSRMAGKLPLVVVPNTRAALGQLAAAVHANPSNSLRLIGVTGTDGKSTSTHLIAHVLDAGGFRAGYLSSVGFETGAGFQLNAEHMTTLEATEIQSMLAAATQRGRHAMVIEASSEGLAQHRLEGCVMDVAVFTNLTRDHLDFHGSMERYLEAKGLLFQMLARPSAKTFPRAAVLNADDPASDYLRGLSEATVTSYGIDRAADLQAVDVEAEGYGLAFQVRAGREQHRARLPLMGRFNAYNSLAALGVARSQGAGLAESVDALASFGGVPGRLERLDCGQPFGVFVDIASTPAALENVLTALRPGTLGRLWAVFGAAGGRDPARRLGMGVVAGRLADRCVLTNEDPRDEDPDAIVDAIAQGLTQAGRAEGLDFVRLLDRHAAIAHAFENARPGDTVLLAGKGTETMMILASGPVAWDERTTARQLLGSA